MVDAAGTVVAALTDTVATNDASTDSVAEI